MAAPHQPQNKSTLKNPIFYSFLVMLAILLYVAWIFFARWQENRGIQRRAAEENSRKQREGQPRGNQARRKSAALLWSRQRQNRQTRASR